MRTRRRLPVEEEVALDMTPMLDVVFILLIFFIVTTTFVSTQALEVTPPSAATGAPLKGQTVALNLYVDGHLTLLGQSVEREALPQKLSTLNKEQPLLLNAAAQVPHQQVVALLDLLRQAGFKQLAITVLPADS